MMRTKFNIGREPQRIKVAVLDTGADANHPDFLGKPIMEYKSFLNGGNARVDPSGHGTHIAGIVLDLASNVELYIAQVTDSRLSANRDRIVEVGWRLSFILSYIVG
jgi:subtilisin family serine protease